MLLDMTFFYLLTRVKVKRGDKENRTKNLILQA
jgi:hypothetical protein